ncbi:methyltransferase [Tropicimonas sp. IMCC34043]|uniref:methyltransferase n=1 Tax=Tropicimonas sp. IMCC34043 TaxID=2248760 RepID=UPI000E27A68C|nr:methyltransferase [Tropicimonas sp. IMCC34043]
MGRRSPAGTGASVSASVRDHVNTLRARLIASARFNRWARRLPVLRGIARRNGQDVFDLMSGFVYSQVLSACVELDLLAAVAEAPRAVDDLAAATGVSPARMETLCNAAAALEILTLRQGGRYGLGRLGAPVLSVPGLAVMIRHHALLFRDLADPVALLRGETDTELAAFWPYVGGGKSPDAPTAAAYSDVMAASQALVAEETLRALDLRGIRSVMDLGGGDGSFLIRLAQRWPDCDLRLFDLPEVAARAAQRFEREGVAATAIGGSFDDAALPKGAEAITLVRVLYDHDDDRVERILALAFEALAPGGKIVISEPMAGGRHPSRAGDAYFGFYTMAMTTGRPRSVEAHMEMLKSAGFTGLRASQGTWPFVTSVVTAIKSDI